MTLSGGYPGPNAPVPVLVAPVAAVEHAGLLEARVATLETALEDACEVAIWMSGSPLFSPDGEGGACWAETMRPKLYAAMAARRGAR